MAKFINDKTHPTDEVFVSGWRVTITGIAGLLIPIVGRVIYTYLYQGLGSLVYMGCLHCIILVMAIFLKDNTKSTGNYSVLTGNDDNQ